MKAKLFDYIERDNFIYNLSGATKLLCFLFLTFTAMYAYDIRVGFGIMIFSFSLKDAEESSQQSDWMADKLAEIVEVVEDAVNTKINIRKIAHFCEYALLGAETSFLCFLIEENSKKFCKYMNTFSFSTSIYEKDLMFCTIL